MKKTSLNEIRKLILGNRIISVLIPTIYEYVILCDKGELSLQMELRLLINWA